VIAASIGWNSKADGSDGVTAPGHECPSAHHHEDPSRRSSSVLDPDAATGTACCVDAFVAPRLPVTPGACRETLVEGRTRLKSCFCEHLIQMDGEFLGSA
jgi:hypothetical protein